MLVDSKASLELLHPFSSMLTVFTTGIRLLPPLKDSNAQATLQSKELTTSPCYPETFNVIAPVEEWQKLTVRDYVSSLYYNPYCDLWQAELIRAAEPMLLGLQEHEQLENLVRRVPFTKHRQPCGKICCRLSS